jgi:hypothetical protein
MLNNKHYTSGKMTFAESRCVHLADIKPGQGMYFNAATNTYRSFDCGSNNYGVKAATYGLSATPCHDCLAGMMTDPTSSMYHAENGFTDAMACVTMTSYGYDARVATKCPASSWNAGGNHKPCTPCATGLSTKLSTGPDNADWQDSEDDCTLAVGFGFHDDAIVPCPLGR